MYGVNETKIVQGRGGSEHYIGVRNEFRSGVGGGGGRV